jgi:hypothetical protein
MAEDRRPELVKDLEIDDGDEDRNDFTMCELGLKEAKQNMASR